MLNKVSKQMLLSTTIVTLTGLLLLGLAGVALAHGLVDQDFFSGGTVRGGPGQGAIGQTFVPTVNNIVGVQLKRALVTDPPRLVRVSIHEDSPDGPELGAVSETRSDFNQHFDFDAPIPLIPGQTYAIRVQKNATFSPPAGFFSGAEATYGQGTMWDCNSTPCTALPERDLLFKTLYTLDSDEDGVDDADDLCPGTDLTNDTPPEPKKNRYFINASGEFVDGEGNFSGYTIADTGGCSSQQIIEAAGLGGGQAKSGISRSALEDWIAAVAAE